MLVIIARVIINAIHGKVAVLTIDAPVVVWENIVDQTQTVDQENAVNQIFVVAIVGEYLIIRQHQRVGFLP